MRVLTCLNKGQKRNEYAGFSSEQLWNWCRALWLADRTFFGTTTEETVGRQISLLWEIVGVADDLCTNNYMVAAYENPGVPSRRNEIWFIRRGV